MTTDEDAERAEIRERYHAERARVAAVTDDEWTARREEEARIIREYAVARRRTAA